MTPTKKTQKKLFALALIGVIAAVLFLKIRDFIRVDTCLDGGGKIDAVSHSCMTSPQKPLP